MKFTDRQVAYAQYLEAQYGFKVAKRYLQVVAYWSVHQKPCVITKPIQPCPNCGHNVYPSTPRRGNKPQAHCPKCRKIVRFS
jgi:hypothetical protein